MMDDYFLVNVVHNDFNDVNAIFKGFYEAGQAGNQTAAIVNSLANVTLGSNLANGPQVINDVAHGIGKEIEAQS